jgi:hypothetical protein
MIVRVVKRVALLWALLRATPWPTLIRAHDRSSETVVWLHHLYPRSWLGWVAHEDTIVKDFGLMIALAEAGISFRIVGGTDIDNLSHTTVFYSIHHYNPHGMVNYSASLMGALRAAEEGGNRLFPSADEAAWWENKAFMHREFERLDVHCPRTIILGRDEPFPDNGPEFPLLVKEPHSSGSMGVHKIESREALDAFRRDFADQGEDELLVQQLLDMHRDLRVTLVGGSVIHHYFRINQSEEWKPTSTRRGSVVDFETFPEKWRDDIVATFRSTGLSTGAFDIAWQGDDLETRPFYLEISPAYTPNPPPPASMNDRPYDEFKKQHFGRESYPRASVEIVFEIHRMLVTEWNLHDQGVA